MLRESGLPAVLFDDWDDFVFHELARRLADQFFLVVELRVEIDEVHTAIAGHKRSWEQISLAKKGQSAPAAAGQEETARLADLKIRHYTYCARTCAATEPAKNSDTT